MIVFQGLLNNIFLYLHSVIFLMLLIFLFFENIVILIRCIPFSVIAII